VKNALDQSCDRLDRGEVVRKITRGGKGGGGKCWSRERRRGSRGVRARGCNGEWRNELEVVELK